MYEFKAYTTGKIEITNTARNKVVFTGVDKMVKSKAGTVYKFANVKDLMSTIGSWVSLATLKKISTKLCAW